VYAVIKIDLKGEHELITRLSVMPDRLRRALVRKITQLDLALLQRVQAKLRGTVLQL
jgi:hypothetical protein